VLAFYDMSCGSTTKSTLAKSCASGSQSVARLTDGKESARNLKPADARWQILWRNAFDAACLPWSCESAARVETFACGWDGCGHCFGLRKCQWTLRKYFLQRK